MKRKAISIILLQTALIALSACGGNSTSAGSSLSSSSSADMTSSSTSNPYPITPDTESDLFSLYYENSSSIKNCAEGVLLITKKSAFSSSTINTLDVRWGDKSASFTDYSALITFDELKASDFEYDFGSNALIPLEATKIWVNAYDASSNLIGKASIGVETYKEKETLQAEYQIISDTHVLTSSPCFYRRTKKTFEDIKKNSPNSSGIIANGDIIDEVTEANYSSFFDAFDSVYDSRDQLHIGLGNHEFIVQSETNYASASETVLNKRYNDRLALWEEKTGNTSAYFSQEINGTYFIYLGTTKMPQNLGGNTRADCVLGEEQLTWLKNTLVEANKINKPIFLLSHGSLRDTVSGSLTSLGQTWYGYSQEEETELRNIIEDYPQILFFSSHSHWCFESKQPYLITDNYPTFFNTGAIGYLWQGSNGGEHYLNGDYENGGAQGLYVEVYDKQVIIKGRQFEASDKTSQYWFSGYQVVLPF